MLALETQETVGLSQCQACGAEGIENDKYCRRCGFNHSARTAPLDASASTTDSLRMETRPLYRSENRCCSFSGALVNIVTEGVADRAFPFHANRMAMRMVSALIAIPLWMMIVLLSPLDAYIAAREISRQA